MPHVYVLIVEVVGEQEMVKAYYHEVKSFLSSERTGTRRELANDVFGVTPRICAAHRPRAGGAKSVTADQRPARRWGALSPYPGMRA